MQPSLSTRSKLIPVAVGELAGQRARFDHGVGGDHHQHGGQAGRQHRGALRHPAHRPAVVGRTVACLATVSVVMIAWAACGATVDGQVLHQGGDRGGDLVHRQPDADQSGGADGDVDAADVVAGRLQRTGRLLGGRGACRRSRPGRCRRWPRRSSRSRPAGSRSASTCRDHSTGAACTRLLVNTPAARPVRSVVEHQGQIGGSARLQPGGDTGGGEPPGRGDAHCSSSSVSTVWPAASQTSIA